MKKYNNKKRLKARRQMLRNNSTPEEMVLWDHLRKRKVENLKFRRQHSIGYYILDFYCPAKKNAVEIDGLHHSNQNNKEYDDERTSFLNGLNIKVIRISNSDIKNNIDKVIQYIKKEVSDSK